MIITILLFFGILATLILVHEWGHFMVARKAGIRVDEFGFGFPPKLFSVKKGETTYSMNAVPLGGFVKIYGEEGEGENEPESFSAKPVSIRMAVVLAGVTMNFLLAIALLSFGFWYGLPEVIDDTSTYQTRDAKVMIMQIAPDSPAAAAGIKVGDAIIAASFRDVKTDISGVKEAQDAISSHKGEEFSLFIQRGDEVIEKKVTPRKEAPKDQGALGVVLEKTAIVAYPWYRAIEKGVVAAFSMTWVFLTSFFAIIVHLVREGKLIADIAGPVGIGALTHQVTQLGLSYVIQFAAILSINLTIINALPFPALDGGRFIFLAIEKVKGSPVSRQYERVVHMAGFAILITLMVVVTARDIAKLF